MTKEDFQDWLKPDTKVTRQVQDEMLQEEFDAQLRNPYHAKAWAEMAEEAKRHGGRYCGCATCKEAFAHAMEVVRKMHEDGFCFRYLVGFTAALTLIAKISTQMQVGAGPFPTPAGEMAAALSFDEDYNQMITALYNLDTLRQIVDFHIEKAREVKDGKIPQRGGRPKGD